ncbi:hypothetical protein ARTHRO8AJ_390161 [Arthrobacter sp. 8AJ]|nr:hypothetical protein ARTHRO8AJ_390161 [Arthrobacter sp. 8AJ]
MLTHIRGSLGRPGPSKGLEFPMEHYAAWLVSRQAAGACNPQPGHRRTDGVRLYRNYFDVEGH